MDMKKPFFWEISKNKNLIFNSYQCDFLFVSNFEEKKKWVGGGVGEKSRSCFSSFSFISKSSCPAKIKDNKEIFHIMAVKVNQFLGIIFGILSSLCFSLCSVIAKYLIEISPVELTLYRCLKNYACSIKFFFCSF